ncbi:MAG: O-antigen ligase family protein [Solirubrobacterales bacterium]
MDKIFEYMIYLYIIILPLTPSKFKIGQIPFNGDIILALIILGYGLKIIVDKSSRTKFMKGFKDFFTHSIGICMALVILIMFCSVMYSMDKKMALNESARFTSYIVLFFIVKYEISSEKILENIIKIYFGVCLIIFSKGILDYVTALTRVGNSEYFNQLRTASTLENANNLGTFAIISLFPAITLFISEKRIKQKLVYAIISLAALANIVASYSRSALLGVMLGCVLITLFYNIKFIIGFIAMGAAALIIPATRIRILQVADMTQNDSRIKIWKTASYMIKDHLALGVGNGNFYTLYGNYIKKHPELTNTYDTVQVFHPHNIFLKIQCELGLAGTASFVGMIISIFRNLIRYIRNEKNPLFLNFSKGFLISITVFMAMNLIDNFFSAPKVIAFFWIFIAIFESLSYNRNCAEMKGELQ